MTTQLVDHRGRPRVAISGIGLRTPAGNTPDDLFTILCSGRSSAAPITLFDSGEHPVSYACEVADFAPNEIFDVKEIRRNDRATLLALAAADDALVDAGDLATDPARCGVVAGSGIGGIRTLEDQVIGFAQRGPDRVSPMLVPMMMPNAPAASISIRHRLTGPNMTVATACATGAHAIGEATRMIRDGTADVVIAGGVESCISPVAMAAFHRMGALSRNPDASRASRPFDTARDGFVMGEGAAFVVLESLTQARARGTTVHGEILGYGANCDAHHITAPLTNGEGAATCIGLALCDAGLEADAIGHVNAHGTSTPHNDAAEAAALAKVFGDHAVPVTSTKGVTGHLIGAAGALEVIAALLAATHALVPPTANHETCDLPVDVVSGAPRAIAHAPALSTSFAFGGHNAALVVAPPS